MGLQGLAGWQILRWILWGWELLGTWQHVRLNSFILMCIRDQVLSRVCSTVLIIQVFLLIYSWYSGLSISQSQTYPVFHFSQPSHSDRNVSWGCIVSNHRENQNHMGLSSQPLPLDIHVSPRWRLQHHCLQTEVFSILTAFWWAVDTW